jgi:hypothetical protein
MGKWLNSTNTMAVLLAGAGVFYQLATIPRAPERSKADREQAAARQPELEQCAEAAVLLHDISWASACMRVAQEAEARHAACLKDPLVMSNPQLGEAHCDKTYSPLDDSAECTLPAAHAATLNASLQEAEDRCLAQVGAKSRRPSAKKSTAPGG